MLKRLIGWFARPDFATLEKIKLDYLERGHARGKAAMRHGSLFDLYLVRSDLETQIEQLAAWGGQGAAVPRMGTGLQYCWWAVVGEQGQEVCLGPLETIEPADALNLYIEQLSDATLDRLCAGNRTPTSLPRYVLQKRRDARTRNAANAHRFQGVSHLPCVFPGCAKPEADPRHIK